MPKIKSYKHFLTLAIGFVVVLAAYLVFASSPYFDQLKTLGQENKATYVVVLTIFKIAGIVWPPIPGGILTLGSIPIIGVFWSYVADFIGSLVGTILAFSISRKYGRRIISNIIDDESIQKLEKLSFKEGRQLEMLLLMMIFGGGAVIEVVAYATGLVPSIKLRHVIIARIISHLLVGLPSFIFLETVISGKNIIIQIVMLLLLLPILWKLRYRYLEL
jgi:uncharacterized membrane protein YdjX (TVP38/TMEM64 family)